MTPLAGPRRLAAAAQIGPIMPFRVVACILQRDAFGGSLRKIVTARCLRQRRKRIGKTSGAMRHAVERLRAETLPEPATSALAPDPALLHQMLAALYRAPQGVVGCAVAIKPEQAENGAGAAADGVQLLVRRDHLVRDQRGGRKRVGTQAFVAQQRGDDGKAIDDRAEAGAAAETERTRHAGRVAAFQALSQVGKAGKASSREEEEPVVAEFAAKNSEMPVSPL